MACLRIIAEVNVQAEAGKNDAGPHHRRRGVPGVAPGRPTGGRRATRSRASTTSRPAAGATSPTWSTPAAPDLIEADVVDPLPVAGPFEWIFHLASPVTCAHHLAHPIATLRAAAEGTRRVLDLATDCRAVFVLASTSEVYGDPLIHPQVETDRGHANPIGPRSPYDEGKRFAEALAVAYGRERHTQVRIARIFNTYGPRMRPDDGRVIPTFIVRALAGRPLPVFGDGRQTRSFCYVSDMVEGLVALVRSDYAGPVNLGNPDEVSVLDLAHEVMALAPSAGPDRVRCRCPRTTRSAAGPTSAWRAARWAGNPRSGRREGLRLTLDYFRTEE